MGIFRAGACIGAAAAITVAVGGLTACGGGSNEVVAQVAGVGSIDNATLKHWMPVEARLLYQVLPTRRAPRGVIPDPPTYAACVARLRSTPQTIGENNSKATVAQLRERCARKQQELKVLTLNTLIGWYWTIGTGRALGVKVTDAEVRQRLKMLQKHDLLHVDFDKYLKYSGQTRSDMMLRAKVQLFELKLNEQLQAVTKRLPKELGARQQQAAIAKLAASAPTTKQWVARTSCRSGYVTSSCKQYKGPLAPGLPN